MSDDVRSVWRIVGCDPHCSLVGPLYDSDPNDKTQLLHEVERLPRTEAIIAWLSGEVRPWT